MWLSYLVFLAVLPIHEVFNFQVGFTLKLFNIFILLSTAIFVFRKMNGTARMRRTILDFWLWAFFAANMISLIVATNHLAGARILFAILFMYLSFYMTVQCVTSRERFDLALNVLAWSALVTSLYGIYQLVGFLMGYDTGQFYTPGYSWYPRLQSTMGEPAFFANFLLLIFPVLFTYLLHGQYSIMGRKKLLIFLFFIFCALVMTISKGTFLALGLAFPICFHGRKLGFAIRRTLPVILVTTVFLGAVFTALFSFSATIFTKHDTRSLIYESLFNPEQGSYVERFETNETSKSMFLANPVLGVGPSNYGDNYNQYKPIWGQLDQLETKLTPNNIVLNLLAENGVVGLLLFSGLILRLGLRMWSYLRSRTPGTLEHTTMIGLTYGFLSMTIQYLFSAYIYFPHFWVLIGLILAYMAISDGSDKPVDSPEPEATTA